MTMRVRRPSINKVWPESYERAYFTAEPGHVYIAVQPKSREQGQKVREAIAAEDYGALSDMVRDHPGLIENLVTRPFPMWREILDEQEQLRVTLGHGIFPFDNSKRDDGFSSFGTFDRSLRPGPSSFTARNIGHFNALDCVRNWQSEHLRNLVDFRKIRSEAQAFSARVELMHIMYHLTMWREQGRRVYVLDETLYTMLKHTPLPPLPLDLLAFRQHSFYVKLPERTFKLSTLNEVTGVIDREWAEGIMVAIDETEPHTGQQRDLCFIICGDGSSGSANIAYVTIGLGADGLMSDVKLSRGLYETNNYTNADADEISHMTEIVPRVILGLCLYMQSEHPDLEPVPPPPRRDLGVIKSRAKLKKAARLDDKRSHLGYIYVGGRVQSPRVVRVTHTEGRTLDHPVWVSGHWRHQPFGEGRGQRRMVWIRPYRKGPDFEQSLTLRAAKVQPARHKRRAHD